MTYIDPPLHASLDVEPAAEGKVDVGAVVVATESLEFVSSLRRPAACATPKSTCPSEAGNRKAPPIRHRGIEVPACVLAQADGEPVMPPLQTRKLADFQSHKLCVICSFCQSKSTAPS